MKTIELVSSSLQDCLNQCQRMRLMVHRVHDVTGIEIDDEVYGTLRKNLATLSDINDELALLLKRNSSIDIDALSEETPEGETEAGIPDASGRIIADFYTELFNCHTLINKIDDVLNYEPKDDIVKAIGRVYDDLEELNMHISKIAHRNEVEIVSYQQEERAS